MAPLNNLTVADDMKRIREVDFVQQFTRKPRKTYRSFRRYKKDSDDGRHNNVCVFNGWNS